MSPKTRNLALGLLFVLLIGLSLFLIIDDTPVEDSIADAKSEKSQEDQPAPEDSSGSSTKPDPEQKPDQPTSKEPKPAPKVPKKIEPLPEADADGKTTIEVIVQGEEVDFSRTSAFLFAYTEESFAKFSDEKTSIEEKSEIRLASAHRVNLSAGGKGKALLDPKYTFAQFTLSMPLGIGPRGQRTTLPTIKGAEAQAGELIDENSSTRHFNARFNFAKPSDRITITLIKPASITGRIYRDGQPIAIGNTRFTIKNMQQPKSFPMSAARTLPASMKDAPLGTFHFPSVPVGVDLQISTREWASNSLRKHWTSRIGLPVAVDIPALKESQQLKGVEIHLPVWNNIAVKIQGDQDFAAEDWAADYSAYRIDENGQHVEIQKGGLRNKYAGRNNHGRERFERSDRFPVPIVTRGIHAIIQEGHAAGLLDRQGTTYQEFLDYIKTNTTKVTISIEWQCEGYRTWKHEINAIEAIKMILEGKHEISFLAVREVLDIRVQVLDAETDEPIKNAEFVIRDKETHADAEVFRSDSEGRARFSAKGKDGITHILVRAEGYHSRVHAVKSGEAGNTLRLPFLVKGRIEVFLKNENGQSWQRQRDGQFFARARLEPKGWLRGQNVRKGEYEGQEAPSFYFSSLKAGHLKLRIFSANYQVVDRELTITRDGENNHRLDIRLEKRSTETRTLNLRAYLDTYKEAYKAKEYSLKFRYLNLDLSDGRTKAEADSSTRFSNTDKTSRMAQFPGSSFVVHRNWDDPDNHKRKPDEGRLFTGYETHREVDYDPSVGAWLIGGLGEILPLRDTGKELVPDLSGIASIRGRLTGVKNPSAYRVHLLRKGTLKERSDWAKSQNRQGPSGTMLDYLVRPKADGSFDFPIVDPGDYELLVSLKGEADRPMLYFLNADSPATASVSANAGKRVTIALKE